ncbi:hypothetical protein CPB86DRAFT_814374 [Serendipita vermifera]|nr:hypothetical protein CPB86DRAFT_814374 [Serendipita vermifera]
MPPSPRRTISETAHTTYSPHSFVSTLPNSSNAPVTPNGRRVTSATSSPYPTTRQDIEQARIASRTAERTRRVLADLDWWVVMSGQCDENDDEDEDQSENNFDEEEEWEPFQDDGESTADAVTAPISTSENEHNGHLDEEALSEQSESDTTSDDFDTTLLVKDETILGEGDMDQRASSPFFPTTLPPLAPLLFSQVGSEPSRRPSRSYTGRTAANRSSISALTWDYTSSSMMITSVVSNTPSSTTVRTPACRPNPQSLCRAFGVAPGSISDSILKDALTSNTATSSPQTCSSQVNAAGLVLRNFPMSSLMTSPSILTFR